VERAELRKTMMNYPEEAPSTVTKPRVHKSATNGKRSAAKKKVEMATSERRRSGRLSKQTTSNVKESKRRGNRAAEVKESGDRSDESSESAYEEGSDDENDDSKRINDAKAAFPIILTTYEILMRDRPHLARHHWGYIVVDEGHRLKNFDCRLMREMKKLTSDGRIILSGTPLQVSNTLRLPSLVCLVTSE
jgi:ATP-dependent DNA helicase